VRDVEEVLGLADFDRASRARYLLGIFNLARLIVDMIDRAMTEGRRHWLCPNKWS